MKTIDTNILNKLIEKYGFDAQMRQAQGECGEFIAVAHNFFRAGKYGHRTETLEDMMEEVVDVYLMMLQMRNIDPEMFDRILEIKEYKDTLFG